jgi:hypothetical protein
MKHLSQTATLLRPLGNLEQMFWLKNQHMPYHFAVCAEIGGRTAIADWRAALDMVQRRHPNFAVQIELNKEGVPCFHHVADERIPLRVTAADGHRWEPEMERELATLFTAQPAPLIRAVLLHQTHRSFFILSAHHSIADTKSLVFAIRDVLQALSGKMLDPLPPIGSLDTLLAPFQKADMAGMSDQKLILPTAEYLDVYRKPDGSWPRISALELTPALTSALRQRSRAEETTVHGALVAAAVEATRQLSDELKQATISVCSAIDARKAVGAGEDVALLSGGCMISMEPQSHPFWETARIAKRLIAPAQSPEGMSSLMSALGQFLSGKPDEGEIATCMTGFKFEINISNLGILPIETQFGELTFETLWGPSILAGFEVENEIGVATINGSLSLLYTSYKPLPSLLELMEKLLVAACS